MGNSIQEFFSDITEPRDSNKRHKLIDIITIVLCAVICGADTWEDIEEFGHTRREWFERFLELPHGIPAHDTFARVFAGINAKEFQQAFLTWVEAIQEVTKKRIVAVDGKTVRRSHEKGKSPLHLVSAWALENKNLSVNRSNLPPTNNRCREVNKCLIALSQLLVSDEEFPEAVEP